MPCPSRSGVDRSQMRPETTLTAWGRLSDRGEVKAMRHYEAMYIVDADTPDENLDPIIEKYKKVVTDGGGEVSESGKWEKGRRPMAYEIGKKREGMYILMQFTSDPEVPKELDRIFRINDEILRHLVVRQDQDEE